MTQPAPNAPPGRRSPRHTGDRHRTAGDARGERAVDGPAVGEQRVAAVDDDPDGDVQPERAARAQRAGRDVHAAGRRHGDRSRRASTPSPAASTSLITRSGDQAGASGTGLLAALLFDAVGTGNSTIQVSGVASTPEGTPVPLQFTPVLGDGAMTGVAF